MADQQTSIEINFKEIILQMQSLDEIIVFRATQAARKIVQDKLPNEIETLVKCGIVPILVRFLYADNEDLQFEATWALGKIANEQAIAVTRSGAIRKLVELLQSGSTVVAQQSADALSAIVSDVKEYRDQVLKCDIDEILLKILQKDQPLSFLAHIACLMSFLCKHGVGRDSHSDKVLKMLPAIVQFLNFDDPDILMFAACAVRDVTNNRDTGDGITAVINAGCIPSLVRLLGSIEDHVEPSLRSLQHILNRNDFQIDVVIEEGVLLRIRKLLNGSHIVIAREAASIVRKILLGNSSQIHAVFESGLFEDICHLLKNGERSSKEAAAAVFIGAIDVATNEQVDYLTGTVLKPVCDLMDSQDVPTLLVTLNDLKNIFQWAVKYKVLEKFVKAFGKTKAVDRLKAMKGQEHENQEVRELVSHLTETYF